MSIITFVHQNTYDEDRIALLWKLMCMVRELEEVPLVWKLTDPFLDAISQFFTLSDPDPRERVCQMTFLDVSIDPTSRDDRLICERATYPVQVVMF